MQKIVAPGKKAAKKYLTNKELLKQIHLSKKTYCWFKDDKYSDYDIILPSLDKINIRTTKQAKDIRKAKLEAQDPPIKVPDKELKNHVIYRVTDYDHIPPKEKLKKNPKTEADYHVKINFPAFKHWTLINDKLVEVGRSHWKGDLKDGHFSSVHGYITDDLAKGFMLLCDRYSMRSNWRGYTYVDEMRSQALLQLSQIGLQFDESKSQNPFAYYTAAITNSFTRILNLEKKSQNIRDDLLIKHGYNPSYTRQLNDYLQNQKSKAEKWGTDESILPLEQAEAK
tara:strand:- start:1223 stop:2068 length:846 start_codon:yes stop_codon:yes gene_type:complete